MDYLPPGLAPTDIKDPIDLAKINWFCRRYTNEYYAEYGFGHFLMAAYASVPALLTPDLLYRIWMNFSTYPWGQENLAIHRVAVADVLLSGLCREIGYELYEMPDAIRFPLRKWLEESWQERGWAEPLKIAAFVEDYHAGDNPGTRRWGRSYTERQTIEAISVRNPAAGQQRLLEWLGKTPPDKKMERYRILDLVTRQKDLQVRLFSEGDNTSKSLMHLSAEYEHNALIAAAQKAMLQGEEDVLEKLVQDNINVFREHVHTNKPEGESIEIKLPAETEREVKRKTTIFAAFIGINQYQKPMQALSGCINDVNVFSEFLHQYAEVQGQNLSPMMLLDSQATVGAIEQVFEHFNQANHGDLCVLYFSGIAETKPEDHSGRQLVMYDSRLGEVKKDVSQAHLEEKIYPLLFAKMVHCLWVIDTHEAADEKHKEHLYQLPLRKNADSLKGSLVILNSSLPGQQTYETMFNEKRGGLFSFALVEVLKEGSTECSYRALINKAKLRMMQSAQNQQPYYEAMPSHAADYRFLSDNLEQKNYFSIKFDPENALWRLMAGTAQGVRPSLDFMHTMLRLRDGRKVVVNKTFPTYSTLRDFSESDTQKTFEGQLTQSALPKVRIAYAPDLPPHMRQRFERAVIQHNLYYIDLTEDAQEAKYTIQSESTPDKNAHAREAYGLFRKEQTLVGEANKPVFGFTQDAFEFIKQLEYIAQWTGVLEYDNQGSMGKEMVTTSFEVIEGQQISPETLNQLSGKISDKTDIITIKYINGHQPAVRCRVAPKGKNTLYISALLLSNSFGIHVLQGGEIKNRSRTRAAFAIGEKNEDILISWPYQNQLFNAIPFTMDDELIKQGQKEQFEYLKIFVSDKPIDLGPLAQEDLVRDREAARSAGMGFNRQSLDLSETEWTALTYPIRVVREEEAEESTPSTQRETLQTLIEKGNPISIRELAQPQYAPALKELRAKLCAMGLLDPIITGDAQTPFKPTADGFESMEDTITAQREFCRARGYKFDKETLTKALLTALVNTSEDDLFPIQLTEKESDNADTRMAKAVLRQMQQEGYWIARSPNMYNIVYVEGINTDGTVNENKMDEWNDLRLVIRIAEGGLPELMAKDVCTTKPGQFYTQNPLNPEGAALVALGQYKAWTIGQHQGRLPALVQRGPLRLHRDSNKNGRRDASDHIDIGNTFGINQHGTGTTTLPEKIGKYSAGTLVTQENTRHLAFMDLVKNDVRVKENEGYLFMGTVMERPNSPQKQNQPSKLTSFYPHKKIIQKMIVGDKINMTAIAWHELLIKISKSVGRIRTADGQMGTGFLLEGGYLLTGHYVLNNNGNDMSEQAELVMNYELGLDGKVKKTIAYKLDASDMFNSPVNELNYTYIKVVDRQDEPLNQWGYLEIERESEPIHKDSAVIISHPKGEDKKISFDPLGIISIDKKKNIIIYKNDTEGGGGGAPVLNSLLHVIAMHIGRDKDSTNYGMWITPILEDIALKKKIRSSTISSVPKFVIIYDQADENHCKLLNRHLRILIMTKKIRVYNVYDVWGEDLIVRANAELADADYVMPLVTINLINSPDWFGLVLEAVTNRRRVIPILVEKIDYEGTGLEKLTSLPKGRAVSEFSNADMAYNDIVTELKKLLPKS